jgi:hypothetical protein
LDGSVVQGARPSSSLANAPLYAVKEQGKKLKHKPLKIAIFSVTFIRRERRRSPAFLLALKR